MMRKPRRPLPTILAITVLLLAQAEAGIGETEAQIQARHGEPITVLQSRTSGAGLTKCYAAHGYVVAVTYLNGRSGREMIAKADNSKITAAEIEKLLQTNAGVAAASAQQLTGPTIVTAGVQEWRSTDQRSRVAFYDSQSRALFITTQKFIDLTNAKRRAVTMRADPGLGARGNTDLNMRAMQKDSAMAFRRGQAQPSASPAK